MLWLEKNNVGIDTSKMRPVLDIMADEIKKYVMNTIDRYFIGKFVRMKSYFDDCPHKSDLKIKIKNLVLFKKYRITRVTVRVRLFV